jgi:hypothetical protein
MSLSRMLPEGYNASSGTFLLEKVGAGPRYRSL